MEGVQILNEFEVVIDYVFSWHNFWIGLVVGAIIGLVAAISFGCSVEEFSGFIFGLIIFIPLIAGVCGILSGTFFGEPAAYETHYEVAISEEVNMKEFMDKYEILETRGSIYTVKEK